MNGSTNVAMKENFIVRALKYDINVPCPLQWGLLWFSAPTNINRKFVEKSDRWKSREWYGTTRTRWQQPAGSSGRQSSVDAWEHAKPKGKWKEVSAKFEAIDAFVKEKEITWDKEWQGDCEKKSCLVYNARKCSYWNRGSRPWPTQNAGLGWCQFEPRRPHKTTTSQRTTNNNNTRKFGQNTKTQNLAKCGLANVVNTLKH